MTDLTYRVRRAGAPEAISTFEQLEAETVRWMNRMAKMLGLPTGAHPQAVFDATRSLVEKSKALP